ncbi:MAG: FUSC family protein [Proteobacteria bacterium]|nr:FUSC family protein [Pseudomonadota bacterium]
MPKTKDFFFNEHTRHGLKVGLASVLAYVASGLLGLPYAYWAVITTVIVMQMHVADSIQMCLYRFTGTAIGAAMGIAMILIFPPTPLFTLLGIFVGTSVCAYLTRYNTRFRMAAITVAIVYLTSLGDAHRIQFTLFRVAEIGMGVLCAFFVSVVVWPQRVAGALRERLRGQFVELAELAALLMDNFLSLQKKTDPKLFDDLARENEKNREMFHKVFVTERRLFRDDVGLLSLQVSAFSSVLERLRAMLILLNEAEGEGFEIIMAPELGELTQATAAALRDLGAGLTHDCSRLERAISAIEPRFVELRRQGVTQRFDAQRLFQVLGIINSAQHLGDYVLEKLRREDAPHS